MIRAYLNYPNSQVYAHLDPACGHIQKANKAQQRYLRLDRNSLSKELQKLNAGRYKFGSSAATNDMWLEIDFDDLTFELAILNHIHRLLAQKYRPFANCQLKVDCP